MDIFSEIDWQILKKIIEEIEYIEKNTLHDNNDKIELLKRFYQIEKDLAILKKKFELPLLNNLISSSSVLRSFDKTPRDRDIFNKNNLSYNDYFRENDYQYWLIIYLLKWNKEIRTKKITLFKIIDDFIDTIKNASFTWRDIELTASGATRCKTNLRFAYSDLKIMGLVSLYEKELKKQLDTDLPWFFYRCIVLP